MVLVVALLPYGSVNIVPRGTRKQRHLIPVAQPAAQPEPKNMPKQTHPELKHRKKVIEPYTAAWERLANAEARQWCEIKPCRDCGGPVNDGYCCPRCGSEKP